MESMWKNSITKWIFKNSRQLAIPVKIKNLIVRIQFIEPVETWYETNLPVSIENLS